MRGGLGAGENECIGDLGTHFLPPALPTYRSQTEAGHISLVSPLPHCAINWAQVVVSNVNRDAEGRSPVYLGYKEGLFGVADVCAKKGG